MKILSKIGLLLCLLFPAAALANQAATGYCTVGGVKAITAGLNTTNTFLGTFPGCTVTVNIHGGGLATIFSDNVGTPLSNPFTGNASTGAWIFYAANGRYDVTLTATGLNTTISDILLNDPAAVGGAVAATTLTSNTANPATAGFIRAANTDQWCWRNQANTGNVCWSLTGAGNVLNWPSALTITGAFTGTTATLSGAMSGVSATLSGNLTAASVNSSGGAIDGTPIGSITPSTGSFTTLTATGALTGLGATFSAEVAPNVTGVALGDIGHRWDGFIRNLDVAGTFNVATIIATSLTTTNLTTTKCVSMDSVQCIDGQPGATADAQIANAQTALGAHGGTSDGRGYGGTAVTLAAQSDIGSSTFPVDVMFSRATQFNVTMTGGASSVFRGFGGSSLECVGETEPPGFAFQGGFNLANTANIASFFTLANQTSVSGFSLKNCLVQSNNGGALVGTAVFDLVNPLQIFRMTGGGSGAIPNTNLLKLSVTVGGASGPWILDNILLDCAQSTTGLTGCTPGLFTGTAVGTGSMGGGLILGSLFNHPGSGKPAMDFEGDAAVNSVGGILGASIYTESTRNTDVGVLYNNVHGMTDINHFFSARGTAGLNNYSITGATQGVVIINPDNFNLWTNNLSNSINSTSYPVSNGRLLSYWYSGNSGQTKTNVWADSAGELAVIDTNGVTSKRFSSQAATLPNVGILRVGNNEAAAAGVDTGGTVNAQIILLDSSNRLAIVNGVTNGLSQVRITGGSAEFDVTDLSANKFFSFTGSKVFNIFGSSSGSTGIQASATASGTQTLQPASGTIALTSSNAVFQATMTGTCTSSVTIRPFPFSGSVLTCTDTTGNGPGAPMPSTGTIQNLRAKCRAAGSTAGSGAITLQKNGVGQGTTCTIGTGTTCSDTTHTFAVAAGDLITAIMTTGAAETLADCSFTFEKQ